MNRIAALFITIITGALLLYSAQELPKWGDPMQPASAHVSPRYIEKTLAETGVPNAVTSVLADYRGYDTMFETSVIFSAGVAVMMLLRGMRHGKNSR